MLIADDRPRSRDLHDSVAQALYGMTLYAQADFTTDLQTRRHAAGRGRAVSYRAGSLEQQPPACARAPDRRAPGGAGDGRGVSLTVADDELGFDPEAARASGGLGLAKMEERAAKLGGRLVITSRPGEGAQVRVEVRR